MRFSLGLDCREELEKRIAERRENLHLNYDENALLIANTFANYAQLKAGCAVWIRPKLVTWSRIFANKTGSGFSGSSFIVSSTYL